jgi:hypothetical protein
MACGLRIVALWPGRSGGDVVKITTAQLPGPETSQDRVFADEHTVVVLDGASAFTPVDVTPGDYAACLGAFILSGTSANGAADLKDVLAQAIGQAARELDLRDGSCPSSTVAILRAAGGQADLLALGDSSIFFDAGDGAVEFTDSRLAELPTPERRQYRENLRAGRGYDDAHRALLARLQLAQRSHRNRPGGYWIAEREPSAARHARTLTLPASTVRWAVLATDGFVNTARHLGLDDWAAIAQRDTTSLHQLLQQCHDWEENKDPDGQDFPRSKRHDDKTVAAVVLR